jgi:2'-5' RNA ligase
MNGIASLLDRPATTRVALIWQDLEARCGLVGVKTTPFPHVSWQVTEDYKVPLLEKALDVLSGQIQPLTIHTTGLGLFTGENPILYISILKDEPIMRLHSLLWEKLNGIGLHPSPYYSPAQWVPHITLAFNDLNRQNLDCAMQYLAFQSFDWEILIDNLVFVAQSENQPPEIVEYHFDSLSTI